MLDPFSFLAGLMTLPTLAYLLLFLILTIEIAYEAGTLATVTLGAFAGVSIWFHWISPEWMLHNWGNLLIGAGVYVAVGVIWTFGKWYFFVKQAVRNARTYLTLHGQLPSHDYPPQVNNHKSDIMRWLSWWPFSFVGTILNDPLRRLFEAVYDLIGDSLQKMSDGIIARAGLKAPERKT